MKKLFYLFLVLISINTYSQQNPPPVAKPTSDNKVLIDELIKVTEYENFFKQYCLMKIRRVSYTEKWTEEYKKDVIESIKFKYYIDTIYNAFSFTDKNDLLKMINFYRDVNKNAKHHKYVITNEMMANNLEGFADSLVKGKYIVK
ncbi:hypothetical protein OBK13_13165 [Empedobacter falsenii]